MGILIGTRVESRQEFLDTASALSDPDTVTLVILAPDGTRTTLVYLTDSEITRVSLGVYSFDHVPDQAGDWGYRWAGTGANAYAEETFVNIEASRVLE